MIILERARRTTGYEVLIPITQPVFQHPEGGMCPVPIRNLTSPNKSFCHLSWVASLFSVDFMGSGNLKWPVSQPD